MDTGQKLQIDFVHDAGLIPERHGVHVVGSYYDDDNVHNEQKAQNTDVDSQQQNIDVQKQISDVAEILRLKSIKLQKHGVVLEYWTIPMYEQLSFNILDNPDMAMQVKLEQNCLKNQQTYIEHLQKTQQKAARIAQRAQRNLDYMMYLEENVNEHADCVNADQEKQLKLLCYYQQYTPAGDLEAPYYGKSIKTYLSELETRRQLSLSRQIVSKLRNQVQNSRRTHNGIVMIYKNEDYVGSYTRPVRKSYFVDQERYVPAQRAKVREQTIDQSQFYSQILTSLKKLKRNAMHDAVRLKKAQLKLETTSKVIERWIKQNAQLQRQMIIDAVKRTNVINQKKQQAEINEIRRSMIHQLQDNILITTTMPMRPYES